jgi:hypothetical protein
MYPPKKYFERRFEAELVDEEQAKAIAKVLATKLKKTVAVHDEEGNLIELVEPERKLDS